MFELFQAMLWPIMAALLLPPALIYFGFGLLERRNPFAALALPQLALLGPALAAFLSIAPSAALPCSVALPLIGGVGLALAFPGSNTRRELFSAGLFFAAAGATVLLKQRQSEDLEQVKHLFLGEILLVNQSLVLRTFAFGAVAAIIAALLSVLLRPGRSADLAFYAVFAIFLGKFVEVGGVALTFFYTIAPALCALRLARNRAVQIAIGSAIAALVTVLTIFLAYRFEVPSIPVLAGIFGIITLPCALIRAKPSPA